MTTLTGDRIILRQYRVSDAAHIYKWQRDETTTMWMGRRYRTPKSLEEITSRIRSLVKNPPSDAVLYAIADKITNCYLGGIDITSIDWIDKNGVLSAVIAEKPNRNRGIATVAITLLLNYAFRELQLHKIELRVASGNKAAVACYTNVGFAVEGILKDHTIVDGNYCDITQMGLLEANWNGNGG
jgi:RimJ/RimL family protein N-acetyltransferase